MAEDAQTERALALPAFWEGPGLVDLQVNGYAGLDFNSPAEQWTPEALEHVRKMLRRRGVLAAFPTLITDDLDAMLRRVLQYARLVRSNPLFAEAFPRLHIEGPCISPLEGPRGAHPEAYCLRPTQIPDFIGRIVDASEGRIGLLTVAPELDGAIHLTEEAARAGIRVALGHTAATRAHIQAAIAAGACMSTHLGNGSHQMLPRLDNYVQVQLAEDGLAASFIADGHHIPFHTLKNFLRAKTYERSVLVTDAMAAADAGPGLFTLRGEPVVVSPDLRVSKPGEDNLAGSALTLDRAVLNVCRYCGVPFETAWNMASTLPAALCGIPAPDRIAVGISESGFTLA